MFDVGEGRAWTADEVCARLIQAMAEFHGVGIHSPRVGEFVDLAGHPIRAGQWIKLVQTILGRSTEAEQLFAWARSQAGLGASLRETCRVRGWHREEVNRARDKACKKIAAVLAAVADVSGNPKLDNVSNYAGTPDHH
jgi:hypothetical protein